MTDLPPFDQMHREWEIWTDGVVHELNALGIDINDEKADALARAIQLWGEELALLRDEQGDQVSLTAIMEKRAAWAVHRSRREEVV